MLPRARLPPAPQSTPQGQQAQAQELRSSSLRHTVHRQTAAAAADDTARCHSSLTTPATTPTNQSIRAASTSSNLVVVSPPTPRSAPPTPPPPAQPPLSLTSQQQQSPVIAPHLGSLLCLALLNAPAAALECRLRHLLNIGFFSTTTKRTTRQL